MEHKTTVDEELGGWSATCSCHWSAYDIKTQADAQLAADTHVRVANVWQHDAVLAAIKRVHLAHQDTVRISHPGRLMCSCGHAIRGYPIGAEAAAELWMIHYAEAMRTALQGLTL